MMTKRSHLMTMREAMIFDAVRTPRGKGKSDGALYGVRPIDLAASVLKALKERNHLDTSQVDDVILGCVTPVGEQGANIAKIASLYAGYGDSVSGVTINRFCASGLEAINMSAAYISSGVTDLMVAGGVESMSRIPMASDGGAWSSDPQVASATSFIPQGISADLMATLDGITREDVDRFAVESQKRAAIATEKGYFKKSIIPVKDMNGLTLLDRDEIIRADATLEGLATLKPAFDKMGKEGGFDSVAIQKYPHLERISHVHHAGNSSGIVDGAAAVLLGSREAGARLGLKPRAKIRSIGIACTDPTLMLDGPTPATCKALTKAGLTMKGIDLVEINEAFAAVVLRYLRRMEFSTEKTNVNGGAIALGHPLGATGSMLMGTLLDELERRDQSLGIVTLCIGGGMGVATVIERV
jgi:acetyl-CoA C-acetyltransferase